jgi:hypothetical protein
MSSHYATGTVWISNLDSEGEADDVRDIVESALRSAGYYADATITAHPNTPLPEETP